jgi:hypothetical protein
MKQASFFLYVCCILLKSYTFRLAMTHIVQWFGLHKQYKTDIEDAPVLIFIWFVNFVK